MPATLFATSLRTAFIAHSAKVVFGEIPQFRALMNSFTSLSSQYFIEEFHGSKHQIYFDTSKPWLPRKRARCELCDLLIISYSTIEGLNVKMTLLQIKISQSLYPSLGNGGIFGVDHVRFPANFEQWDLLANRPLLFPTSVFAPPTELLSKAVVPSVGSFGVFHRNALKNVDFFYSSADCVAPVGSPTTLRGRLETSVTSPYIRRIAGYIDVTYCASLFMFGYSLYRLEIGTPVVSTSDSGHMTYHEPLAGWIRGILEKHVSTSTASSGMADEVLSKMRGDDVLPTYFAGALPSVLLLRGEAAPRADGLQETTLK